MRYCGPPRPLPHRSIHLGIAVIVSIRTATRIRAAKTARTAFGSVPVSRNLGMVFARAHRVKVPAAA